MLQLWCSAHTSIVMQWFLLQVFYLFLLVITTSVFVYYFSICSIALSPHMPWMSHSSDHNFHEHDCMCQIDVTARDPYVSFVICYTCNLNCPIHAKYVSSCICGCKRCLCVLNIKYILYNIVVDNKIALHMSTWRPSLCDAKSGLCGERNMNK